MAQGKGGGLATILMVVSFVVIGGIFYWLSIVAVPSSAPEAVEAPAAEVPAEMPAPDTDATETPATN